MNLEQAAAELYAAPPNGFVAARTRLAQEAKDSDDVRLARDIGKLKRPTVSAWAVNLLSTEPALDELIELGDRLRTAWAAGEVDLGEISERRTRLIDDLVRLARELTGAKGQPLSDSAAIEVQKTLDAATVDADAAEQAKSGRLLRPLEYSGFTPMPVAPRPAAKPRQIPSEEDKQRDAERLAEAQHDQEEWAAELADADRELTGLQQRMAELERELDELRPRLPAAERRHKLAKREEDRARRALDKATRRLKPG